MKDEDNNFAVFPEQGTSASSMSATSMMDALARFDGMDGEDSDALGAYHQTVLGGPPTWIKLPKHRWPKHWHGKYTDPVVRLRLNLYGHPLAGLYWDKLSQEQIKQ